MSKYEIAFNKMYLANFKSEIWRKIRLGKVARPEMGAPGKCKPEKSE
jgi:hypothetical protein